MSLTNEGPEAQDALFDNSSAKHVPPSLARATLRLEFPPSYVLVGVYRLFTDKHLYKPAWDKCRHAARRGAIVGAIWACLVSLSISVLCPDKLKSGVLDILNSKEVHQTLPFQVCLF
jgi:hypothetical protein